MYVLEGILFVANSCIWYSFEAFYYQYWHYFHLYLQCTWRYPRLHIFANSCIRYSFVAEREMALYWEAAMQDNAIVTCWAAYRNALFTYVFVFVYLYLCICICISRQRCNTTRLWHVRQHTAMLVNIDIRNILFIVIIIFFFVFFSLAGIDARQRDCERAACQYWYLYLKFNQYL